MNFINHSEDPGEEEQHSKNTISCPLKLIPQELFRLFSEYLLESGKKKRFPFNDDWRNFLNTSKSYFAELKRQTRYIALSKNSYQFLGDPLFRQSILSLVNDPSLQISCCFQRLGEIGEDYDASLLCNLNQIDIFDCYARSFSLMTNVESLELRTEDYLNDFNCFAQIKKVLSVTIVYEGEEDVNNIPVYDLSCLSPTLESLSLFTKRVSNYDSLTNLHYVEFTGCDSIAEVSCFRGAKTVHFINCTNVTDVSSLANVKELVLISCPGITDVSSLGGVEIMEISTCKNLHDLSPLSTVHTLVISHFPVDFLSTLNQNTVLNLSGFSQDLTSIQFLTGNKHLRELDISNNENIPDISMLQTVEVLDITRCFLITSLIGLSVLKELAMIGVTGIESGFEVLQQLTKLTIGDVGGKNKKRIVEAIEKAPFLFTLNLYDSTLPISSFIQVQRLTLEYCDKIAEFPTTLIQLKTLRIVNCNNLKSFSALLPALQILVIDGSNKLSLLKICDGEPPGNHYAPLKCVKLARCISLKEIQITRRILSFDIRNCQNLKEISGKEFIRQFTDKREQK
jgi:hypothetical protein